MEEVDKISITLNSYYGTKKSTYTDFMGNSRSDSSNVQFYFPGRPDLVCELDEQFTMAIVGGSLPITFYNINSLNNTIVITGFTNATLGISNATLTFTIQIGNYDVYSLQTALNIGTSDITSTDGTIVQYASCTINSTTYYFGDFFSVVYDTTRELFTIYSIYNSSGYQGNSKDTYAATTATTVVLSSSSTASKLLGFLPNISYSFSTITSYGCYLISTTLIDVSYTKLIYVTSSLGTNAVVANGTNVGSDVLAVIHLTQNSPSIMTLGLYNDVKISSSNLSNFNIVLLDQDRNVLVLNGVDWALTFDLKRLKMSQDQVQTIVNTFNNLDTNPSKRKRY